MERFLPYSRLGMITSAPYSLINVSYAASQADSATRRPAVEPIVVNRKVILVQFWKKEGRSDVRIAATITRIKGNGSSRSSNGLCKCLSEESKISYCKEEHFIEDRDAERNRRRCKNRV
jgi:hypothetical protein